MTSMPAACSRPTAMTTLQATCRRAARLHPATANAAPDRLAQMCGDDSRDVAGLPIDLIQQVVEPIESATRRARRTRQRLGHGARRTSRQPARRQNIADGAKPACLDAATHRGDDRGGGDGAAVAGSNSWGLLNDEQKARLTALGDDQRRQDRRQQDATDRLPRACDVCATGRAEDGRPRRSRRGCTRATPNVRSLPRCRTPAPRRRTILQDLVPRPTMRSRHRRGSRPPANGSTPCCRRSS